MLSPWLFNVFMAAAIHVVLVRLKDSIIILTGGPPYVVCGGRK